MRFVLFLGDWVGMGWGKGGRSTILEPSLRVFLDKLTLAEKTGAILCRLIEPWFSFNDFSFED